ncbi:MAG: ferritin-like domain-containing protein, partial [Gemmatimonadales bacterium]
MTHMKTDRRDFLAWTGAVGAGVLLGACADADSLVAPSSTLTAKKDVAGSVVTVVGPKLPTSLGSDTDILKFALFLELLESEFYKAAVGAGILRGKVLEVSTNVRDHEICHVTFLQTALAGMAREQNITFDFSAVLKNENKYLDAAETFEQTGVGAYLGALPLISDKNIRSAAGTIFTIEARHTAAFRAMNKRKDPAPVAFEMPLSPDVVLGRISPFVVEGL